MNLAVFPPRFVVVVAVAPDGRRRRRSSFADNARSLRRTWQRGLNTRHPGPPSLASAAREKLFIARKFHRQPIHDPEYTKLRDWLTGRVGSAQIKGDEPFKAAFEESSGR